MTTPQKAYRSTLTAMATAFPLILGACEPAETASPALDGVWWSQGYGMLIRVDGDKVDWIEQTPVSCLRTNSSSIDRLNGQLAAASDVEKGVFEIGRPATLSTKNFERIGEGGFQARCPNGLTGDDADPVLNFETLWHTFDQHYAFFEQRGVDWDAVYDTYRPKVTEDTSREQLARIFGDMLNPLKDGHIGLYADGRDVVWVDTTLWTRLRQECREKRGDRCNVDAYYEDLYDDFQDVLKESYLDNDVEIGLRGRARWGEIDDKTGYFRIDAMEGFVEGSYWARDDIEAVEEVLDEMLDDIGDLPSMIVDVRLNGGGHDTVSTAIASRFAEKRTVFGNKHPYAAGDSVAPTEMVVEPYDGEQFEGDVALLISGETASAAEIFAMAMRALPQVALIGSPTQGILSDELYRTLPNGWSLSLSNEIYLTHDRKLFEGIGVPPEIEAAFLVASDLDRDIDQGIETALSVLGKKNGASSDSY